MTKIIKSITLVVIAIMICTTSVCAFALSGDSILPNVSDPALDYAADIITRQYKDYYNITDVDIDVLSMNVQPERIEYYAVITFGRVLIADEAVKLPYVAGAVASLSTLDGKDFSIADSYVDALISEIESMYIGKTQDTSVFVYVTAPKTLNAAKSYKEQFEVYVENMNGEKVSPSILRPDDFNDMYKAGQEKVSLIIANSSIVKTNTINDDIKKYNRVTARDYARTWSCTSGKMESHGCNNPDYTYYEGTAGTDCANFVSQCLYAGGLPTDTTWYAYSLAWIRGANIRAYVSDNNLFFKSSNEMKAFAGSIICWNENNHVGLVDQNDTVTMTFCAHSRCRNSCSWSGEDVYFLIPYWDSYSGTWVS